MSNGRISICRSCSQVNTPCVGLFEHHERQKLLSDILIECTAVKVEKHDELPQYICNDCVGKLISAWDFKLMVIDSDLKFKSLKIETESVLSLENEVERIEFIDSTMDNDISDEHLSQIENLNLVNNSDHSENGYVFDENGVPLTKDGRKLSGRERETVPIFCEHCNRSFAWKYYKVHVKQYLGDRPFKCNLCDKGFVQAFQLRRHQKMHTEDRKFTCDICGKAFKHLGNLNLHKGSHTEERSHKCNVCGTGFKQEHRLKAHVQRHDRDKSFVCELCGKSFSDYSSFAYHKGTHATGKTYPCSICGKGLVSPAQKRLHEKRIHSDEKPYVCNYCGRGFKHISTLKRHILIHTGEKPYSCNICGKSFRQRECLPAHMRSHTGETPYVCKLCPAKFKLLHLLKKHMHIHSSYS